MPANVDALVKEGIALLKGGKRMEAKQALMKAVEINQQSEQAWLWLSALVDTPEERLLCLENVIDLNPNNANAKKGIDETKREIAAKGGTPKAAPAADPYGVPPGLEDPFGASSPFAGTGFEANPYGGSAQSSDPALSGWSGFDTPSSSVEWGQPPSSVTPAKGEPTAADYDNWMAGLSINSGGTSAPGFDTGFGTGDPFGNPVQTDDSGFGTSDFSGSDAFGNSDAFGGSDTFGGSGFNFGNADFGSSATSTPAFSPDSFESDPFGGFDAPAAAPVQATSAFGDFNFEEPIPADSFGATDNDPFNLGKPAGGKSDFDFGSTTDFYNTGAPAEPLLAPATLPVTQDEFTSVSDFPAPSFDDDLPASDFDFTETPAASVRAKPVPIKSDIRSVDPMGASIFTTIDSTPSLANPSVYFQQIPEEIQLSGTMRALKQKAATTASLTSGLDIRLVIMVAVLLILNLGSLIVLLSNLPR